MIGNENDARTAFRSWADSTFEHLFSDNGSSRYVFLIDGVIYKVNRYADGRWDANEDEYRNGEKMRGMMPAGVFIPAMDIYDIDGNIVLAMEFVSGLSTGECSGAWSGLGCECDGLCISDKLMDELCGLGWDDPCWGNAIRVGADIYLVDVA